MPINWVDTSDGVESLVADIFQRDEQPLLFIDLEGVALSRHGSVSIIQILAPPDPTVHLVDVFTLGREAYETGSPGYGSLRTLLESDQWIKVFFDVRNDSDALYSHFGIHLRGVVDVQLLEFATRSSKGRFLKGLAKCISEDSGLSLPDVAAWQQVKDAGLHEYAPEKGGSYEVFNRRPLSPILQQYCAQDVSLMPRLLTTYGARLEPRLAVQVHKATLGRVTESQARDYNGLGRHRAYGPIFRRASTYPKLNFPMTFVCSEGLHDRCAVDKNPPPRKVVPSSSSTRHEPPKGDADLAINALTRQTAILDIASLSEEGEDRADDDGNPSDRPESTNSECHCFARDVDDGGYSADCDDDYREWDDDGSSSDSDCDYAYLAQW